MPFRKGGEIPGNRFKKGESGNPNGRTAGTKNRGTITKEVFEMVGVLPEKIYNSLKQIHPELERTMCIEKIIEIVMAHKAMVDMDTQAAKYLKDNRYGLPKGEVDLNTSTQITIKIE